VLNNALTGNDGKNLLIGDKGNDTLDGAAGVDTLKGGLGNDVYVVDDLADVVVEGTGEGKDTIHSTVSIALQDSQEIETLILHSDTAIGANGNKFANSISVVGAASVSITGFGGNDTLTGGAKADTLGGHDDNDLLFGLGGDDKLYGSDGKDTLNGGDGNDFLDGEAGADVLIGGKGDDIYLVPRASEIAIGATVEDAGFDISVNPDSIEALRQSAIRICPALGNAPLLRTWAGIRPATPDMLPILGIEPMDGRLIYACGHSKNGILLAPATAVAVSAIASGRPVPFDITPFRADRFRSENT